MSRLNAPARVLLVAAAGSLVLAGCSSSDRYVCQDKLTHRRVVDQRCDGHAAGYSWWRVKPGYGYPAIGGLVAAGSGSVATPSKKPSPLPSASGKVPLDKKSGSGSKSGTGSGSKSGKSGGSKSGSGSHSGSHH